MPKQKSAFVLFIFLLVIFVLNSPSLASPPISFDDQYHTDEDIVLKVLQPGVLANDLDSDGDTLTTVLESGPSNGTLKLISNGSFNYRPKANFNGTDSFTYAARDGNAITHASTVFITVHSVNDQPAANDRTYSTEQNTTLTVPAPGVLINDSDADGGTLTASLDSDVSNGALELHSDGSFTYSPEINYFGTDSYTYTACDNHGMCDTATATITVLRDRPEINLKPSSLDYGTVIIGNAKVLTAQVQNRGKGTLDVTNIYPCAGSRSEFTISPGTPFMVAHGGSQTLTVTYTPRDVLEDNGCLVIESNDLDQDSTYLSLVGIGAEPIDLDILGFKVKNKVNLSDSEPIKIEFTVRNLSPANESTAKAMVVGVQNIFAVYRETLMVFDPTGGSGTKWSFPSYRPTNSGNIQWSLTIEDDDHDVDLATALTIVDP